MMPYYKDDYCTLYRADVLDYFGTCAASSFDLIIADPPYYKVKDAAWDRAWDTPALFLEWLGKVVEECARVLRPNGSLYLFASPQMSARVEVMIGGHLCVLNNIRWTKWDGWHQRAKKEDLRSYLSPWEAIIFAEHYGSDGAAMAGAGYDQKCDELRGFVFEPLRAYLADEWKRAGLKFALANEACGTVTMAARHYFSRSQWCLPTAEHYASLQAYANRFCNGTGPEYLRRDYEDLRRDYEDLRRDYEDLRRDYEDLRRPFHATRRHAWDDVWTFAPVQSYPGKHECEKPGAMIRQMLEVSSREGAAVLDLFAGSGRVSEGCKIMGRRSVAVEMSEAWCRKIEHRLRNCNPIRFPEPAPVPEQGTLGL